jgi:acyl-coenzyme A thioesterase PaaI-like protein
VSALPLSALAPSPSGTGGSGVYEAARSEPAASYRSALGELRYEYGPDCVHCTVRLGRHFASHSGHIHGGLIATVFDEVMGHAAYRETGSPMVTTLLRVRFVEPMAPECEYRIAVKVGAAAGGVLDVTGEICAETLVAAANAKFRPLERVRSGEQKQEQA